MVEIRTKANVTNEKGQEVSIVHDPAASQPAVKPTPAAAAEKIPKTNCSRIGALVKN